MSSSLPAPPWLLLQVIRERGRGREKCSQEKNRYRRGKRPGKKRQVVYTAPCSQLRTQLHTGSARNAVVRQQFHGHGGRKIIVFWLAAAACLFCVELPPRNEGDVKTMMAGSLPRPGGNSLIKRTMLRRIRKQGGPRPMCQEAILLSPPEESATLLEFMLPLVPTTPRGKQFGVQGPLLDSLQAISSLPSFSFLFLSLPPPLAVQF